MGFYTKNSSLIGVKTAVSKAGVFDTISAQLFGDALYEFTDATFTPGGQGGRFGPSLVTAKAGITSTGSTTWVADTTYFNVTATGIMLWKVPAAGTYRIEVWGARGGSGNGTYLGGYGARMRGDFALDPGVVLKILVGQSGGLNYGGGGGMTAVATSADVPLIVGGGGNTTSPWSSTLSHAVTTESGVASSSGGAGGTAGSGGTGGNNMPGGAGFLGNGGSTTCGTSIVPLSFINGGTGGTTCNSIGGFGGGSGSDGCCQGASGPGGGYSGGGAGSGSSIWGGAGGSYNIGSNQSNDAGNVGTAILAGNGKCIITKL